MTTRNADRTCDTCEHYRPEPASIVDALRIARGKDVLEAIRKVLEDETELRVAEIKLKKTIAEVGGTSWDSEPFTQPICVAKREAIEIPELKNADLRCPDFRPRNARQNRNCGTCAHVRAPQGRPAPPANVNEEAMSRYFAALDADTALEVT